MMYPDYPDIVTVPQMQKMLGISRGLAYKLIREDEIHGVKIGNALRVPKVNIVNYVLSDDGKGGGDMTPERLRVVDADTLLSTPLEKTLFIVEGLIPQGVTLLGGSGKIGKSWLMLRLGLQVAQGLPLWGLRTTRCDVLYLSLEDTMSRLQNRLYRLTDEAPPGLRFATVCGKLGSGLEEQITQALRDYPETKLVIIDTLQKARDSRSAAGKTGLYSADYDDISALKRIADGQRIAIVLVHHLRKQADGNDPFNQLSGSTGITGAADTSMILLRPRGSDTATLLATGRDIDYQQFTLRFEDMNWHLVERLDGAELQREQIPPVLFRLAAFLRGRQAWTGAATELLAALDEHETPSNTITKYLGRYANEVLRPAGIRYRSKRTGQSRLLQFTHDGSDSNDGKSGIPKTPSQPSSPSQMPSILTRIPSPSGTF